MPFANLKVPAGTLTTESKMKLQDAVAEAANPDPLERVRTSAPLNTPDPPTFYTGGAHGYTDYPTLVNIEEAS
jgi:hypothetical protein